MRAATLATRAQDRRCEPRQCSGGDQCSHKLAFCPATRRARPPFAESKEHLGGFYIIEADDLDAAPRLGIEDHRCREEADRGSPALG